MLHISCPVIIIINNKHSDVRQAFMIDFFIWILCKSKGLPGYCIILLSSGPGVQNSSKPPEPVPPISGYFITNKEPSLLWAFKWNRIPYLLKSVFLSTDSSQLTNNPLRNHQGIQKPLQPPAAAARAPCPAPLPRPRPLSWSAQGRAAHPPAEPAAHLPFGLQL